MSVASLKRRRDQDETEPLRKELQETKDELAKCHEQLAKTEHERDDLEIVQRLERAKVVANDEECRRLQQELDKTKLELQEAEQDLVRTKRELQDSSLQIQNAQEYLDGDAGFLSKLLDSELEWCLQQQKERLQKFQEEKDKRLDDFQWEKDMKEEVWMEGFTCGITQKVMRDPVMAEDGIVYERSAIEEWMARNDLSPIKRTVMGKHLKPVLNIKNMIQGKTMEMRKKRKTNGEDWLHPKHKHMETELFNIRRGIPDLRRYDNILPSPPRSPSLSTPSVSSASSQD